MKHIDRFSPPRRSPCFGMPLAGATVGLLLFGVLAVLGMGCASSSATRDTADADKSVVMVTGLQPDWTLDEMVRRSDAVVLGTVQESLDWPETGFAGRSAILGASRNSEE